VYVKVIHRLQPFFYTDKCVVHPSAIVKMAAIITLPCIAYQLLINELNVNSFQVAIEKRLNDVSGTVFAQPKEIPFFTDCKWLTDVACRCQQQGIFNIHYYVSAIRRNMQTCICADHACVISSFM